MKKLNGFGRALAAAGLLLAASAANASIVFNGATFSVETTPTGGANTYLISYAAVIGPTSGYIGNSWAGASLQMQSGAPNFVVGPANVFQNGSDVTSSGYGYFSSYGKIGADEGGCEDTGTQFAVCLQYNGLDLDPVSGAGAPVIASGDTLLWTFEITFDSPFDWEYSPNLKFLTIRFNDNSGKWQQNGGLVSAPIGVPEPGTLALLGLGLAGLGFAGRRRKI